MIDSLPWEPIALAAAGAVVLSRASMVVKRIAVMAAAWGGIAYALTGGFDSMSLPDLDRTKQLPALLSTPQLPDLSTASLPSIDWCALGMCNVSSPLKQQIISIWPEPAGPPGRSFYTRTSSNDDSPGRIRGYALRQPLVVPLDSTQDPQP